MTLNSKVSTGKKALPTNTALEETGELSQGIVAQTQTWVASVRDYIKKIQIQHYAAHLMINANRLGTNANEYLDAARDNFELGLDLDIDDTHQRRDLHILVAQADEYRSRAREIQGQADSLRTKARQLRHR